MGTKPPTVLAYILKLRLNLNMLEPKLNPQTELL